jgi:hypothetical protein
LTLNVLFALRPRIVSFGKGYKSSLFQHEVMSTTPAATFCNRYKSSLFQHEEHIPTSPVLKPSVGLFPVPEAADLA